MGAHPPPSIRSRTVVRAFTDESVAGEVLRPSTGTAESMARSELDSGVAPVLEHLPGRPPVETAVLPGHPRAVLRSAGVGADLPMVGARGHGVLELVLLGSVASAVTHHPTVPTIVVPGKR